MRRTELGVGGSLGADVDESAATQSLVGPASGAPQNAFVLTQVADGRVAAKLPQKPAAEIAIGANEAKLVGQSPVCDVRFDDPSVSRRHLQIDWAGDALRVKDLGSTNGTFVNGVRIVEALAGVGDTIRLGKTELRVERRGAAKAPLPGSMATRFGRVVGASTVMRRLYGLVERLAAVDVPVIIEGETGTGKEAMAEAIHEQGPRASKPFVVLDCTAIPENLMEAELFGHERGAFTGAAVARAGLLEQVDGGTLLIDEIGDLAPSLQPKLLRALERSEFRRVGGNKTLKVDVRILAATRRDLDREVQEGRFRDDLFHRLAVARIEMPPLRERHGDVTLLAKTFFRSLGGDPATLGEARLAAWERHPWPGNVRELRNAVARFVALGDLGVDTGVDEPDAWGPAADAFFGAFLARNLPLTRARELLVGEFERRYVARILDAHGGSVARAAAASGVARRYFQILRARFSPR